MVGEAIVVAALKAAIRVEGVRGIAQRAGVNAGTVSAAVKGRQQVSARLASALGFRKVTRYERVGEK
jgi:L-amino acid N-acyltransferase YncA